MSLNYEPSSEPLHISVSSSEVVDVADLLLHALRDVPGNLVLGFRV